MKNKTNRAWPFKRPRIPKFVLKWHVKRAKKKRGITPQRIQSRMAWLGRRVFIAKTTAAAVQVKVAEFKSRLLEIEERKALPQNREWALEKLQEAESACQGAMGQTVRVVASLYEGIILLQNSQDPEKKKKVLELYQANRRLREQWKDLNRLAKQLKRMGQQLAAPHN